MKRNDEKKVRLHRFSGSTFRTLLQPSRQIGKVGTARNQSRCEKEEKSKERMGQEGSLRGKKEASIARF